jgi:hypothetical protein
MMRVMGMPPSVMDFKQLIDPGISLPAYLHHQRSVGISVKENVH